MKKEQEIIKLIDKYKWKKNKDAESERLARTMVRWGTGGGINGIIDRHNRSLEELKKEFDVVDKKKEW